jgi:hypothetical protein
MEVRNFFKALLCGVAVLFATSATAQNESVNGDTATTAPQVINQLKGLTHYDFTGTPKEAYNFLKSAPADTLVTKPVEIHTDTTVTRCGHIFELTAQDTLYVYLKYSQDGHLSIRRDTLCILNEHVTEFVPVMSELEMYVDSLSQLTKVVDKVNAGRERQRNGYRVRFDNGHEYTVTSKAQNINGWAIGAYAGGEFGGVTGFTVGGRLQYTHKWVSGTLDAGLGTNKYEANAEEAYAGDQMLTFDSRAMGWVNVLPLFKADTYSQWRLELGAGGGLKGYKTKSREVENPDGSVLLVQSQGNAWYWAGALKGTYQPFNKGYAFSVEAGVTQTPNVWQNKGQQNHLTYYVRVGITFDAWRNKVNHK